MRSKTQFDRLNAPFLRQIRAVRCSLRAHFTEQILNQARAERSGNFREVDFFDESDIGAGMERIPEDIRLDEEIYQGGPSMTAAI